MALRIEANPISGSCIVEKLHADGSIASRQSFRNVTASICRNALKDVMVRIEAQKMAKLLILPIVSDNVTIHRKFVKDGKMTLAFKKQLIRVMFSNCAASTLSTFVKMLIIKTTVITPDRPKIALREKQLQQNQGIENISPLLVTRGGALVRKGGASPLKTPNSKRIRTISANDKETCGPVGRMLHAMPISLSKEQREVLALVKSGASIFFTGSAGTGKTFLLRRIISSLSPNSTFVTASTGIAASHLGGSTVHSFAGIGFGGATVSSLAEKTRKSPAMTNWKRCRHLIIDEISLLDGTYFEKLEAVARILKNTDKPFGGIQVILSGDFFQLPPVSKTGQRKFVFQTKCWNDVINKIYELKEVHRQKDRQFVSILQEIRMGSVLLNFRCSDDSAKTLISTVLNKVDGDGILATKLSTHNVDVDALNEQFFRRLPGETKVFKSSDSVESMKIFLDSHLPIQDVLRLKVGAQVMLVKNTKVADGLANGSRGVVTGFDKVGLPIVKFRRGITTSIGPEKWTITGSGGASFSRKQIPLKLAWAMSIHKSQGLTLDAVEISLAKVFESGQAYVALSRASSLQGLKVLDFKPSAVRADPQVIEFYSRISRNGA
ncbi:ATP-dependent DNA helicase PIF1-like isoform X1 [Varroa jacobsoni]|uniref:ATP-dependent DNA helicase PIF1-like isoform X1 n=1 Tax=Varroa jacobsoni TaxID=62625 RepID=UPI000BF4CF28|nr:ATP-dependent DNA helicase PIF1-like isoform X1 [Varroa jacobsoni]